MKQSHSLHGTRKNLASGFVTGLFSIPEGMAYAKLAGVNPAFGLYSAIVPTIVASLSTGTILMVSTITSAIAISTRSVLHQAGFAGQHDVTSALFTLTFLMGVFMLTLGLLRLGAIVNFVSNAVMTGFVLGASTLIIIGELGDLVGFAASGKNKLHELLDWATHIRQWNVPTTVVGLASVGFMLLLQLIPRLKEAASVITLLVGTAAVYFFGSKAVRTVGDIAHIPSGFPSLTHPDIALIPQLGLGAVLIGLVALTQGASISSAMPNPDGTRPDHSRDLVGQGLGNVCGAFFQAMGTGGSLSRTAISVGSGATSRLGGLFAGCWVLLFLVLAGRYAEKVPLAVISGILLVVAGKIILRRMPDVRLIARASHHSTFLMAVTFFSALVIPLQWTIFLGAGLSYLYYLYTSGTDVRLFQIVRNDKGMFVEQELPAELPSNRATIIAQEGNNFFAAVPTLERKLPSIRHTTNSVVIWRMRGYEDAHSTFLSWLTAYSQRLKQRGCKLMVEGVEPEVMSQLKKTGLLDTLGAENVFVAEPVIGGAMSAAEQAAERWLQQTTR